MRSKPTEISCGRPFPFSCPPCCWQLMGFAGCCALSDGCGPLSGQDLGHFSCACAPGEHSLSPGVLRSSMLVPGAAALPGPVRGFSGIVRRCIRRFFLFFYFLFFKWKLGFIPAEGNWSSGNDLKANENGLCRLQPQFSVLLVSCFLKWHLFLKLALKLCY